MASTMPFLDGRAVLLRNHATHDPVDEFESAAPGERLDLEPGVAELAAPAGLLLVPALNGRLSFDRLLVGNLRGLQIHLEAEFPLHLFDGHLDVDLAETGEDHLPGLVVPMEDEGGILIGQAMDRGDEFVLVAPGLWLRRQRR